MKVLAKSLFKMDLEEEISIIHDSLNYLLPRYMKRVFNPIKYSRLWPNKANAIKRESRNNIDKIVTNLIEVKKCGIIPKRDDALDMFLAIEDQDTGEKMDDAQIRDELMTLIIGGHETTAHAMGFMFHLIAKKTLDNKN